MQERPVRVLLVEDDEDDYVLVRELFAEITGNGYQLEWEPDLEKAIAAIGDCRHDLFLVDYRLGARTGLDFLREARRLGCVAPLIMLTGQGERQSDLEAMRAGAADYLEKGRVDAPLLERTLRYALQQSRHEEELRRARDELERRVEERTAELDRLNRELKDADRRKDEFLAMLSHELRNPLAPLRNALEMARVSSDPVAIREAHEIMDRQVDHLIRLVDELLDVEGFTRGKLRLRRLPVEIAPIVARAVEASRPLMDARRHLLEIDLPEVPVWLEADALRLAQLLMNLLNNAAKYTPEGGHISLSVQLGAESDKQTIPSGGLPDDPAAGTVIVRVRDNGAGIPPEVLPRIFDLFAQAERTLDRAEGGLGIGLTLVKRIAELHGGAVEAASDGPGNGSTFTIRLPVRPTQATRPAHERGLADGPVHPSLLRSHTCAQRVLVVDDNRDAAATLARLLRLMGHQVETAHHGHLALEVATRFGPDVVLLDIGLPGLDGFTVCRRLRQHAVTSRARIIAVTGYTQEEDRRRSREAGFDAHLVKPVDLEALEGLLGPRAESA
jgi:signal transduction histidine kinase